jgi:FKBP-type peptidyl-prolyl cis-trans isomerase FklB
MKQITTALLATLLLLALSNEAIAQKSKSKKSESKVDTTSLSYNYGLLLAMSLQLQGVPNDSINTPEVMAGIEKALKSKGNNAAFEKAQAAFAKKMEGIQKLAEKESLNREKKWFDDNAKKNSNVKTLPSGLQYEVLKAGSGEKPTPTSKVTTHYHGTLTDGTIFDSSVERKEPASFPVNGVIKGWQEALPMMNVGSKWKIYVPSALAYGARAVGKIPANSILIFEIELLSIDK